MKRKRQQGEVAPHKRRKLDITDITINYSCLPEELAIQILSFLTTAEELETVMNVSRMCRYVILSSLNVTEELILSLILRGSGKLFEYILTSEEKRHELKDISQRFTKIIRTAHLCKSVGNDSLKHITSNRKNGGPIELCSLVLDRIKNHDILEWIYVFPFSFHYAHYLEILISSEDRNLLIDFIRAYRKSLYREETAILRVSIRERAYKMANAIIKNSGCEFDNLYVERPTFSLCIKEGQVETLGHLFSLSLLASWEEEVYSDFFLLALECSAQLGDKAGEILKMILNYDPDEIKHYARFYSKYTQRHVYGKVAIVMGVAENRNPSMMAALMTQEWARKLKYIRIIADHQIRMHKIDQIEKEERKRRMRRERRQRSGLISHFVNVAKEVGALLLDGRRAHTDL